MIIKHINCSHSLLVSDDIEVKHYIINILSIFLPGYKFMPSVRAGLSDGKKKFYKITPEGNLLIPHGLSNLIKNKLIEKKYEFTEESLYELNDNYSKYSSISITKEEADDFINSLNLPFEPYDFQKKAFIDAINTKRLVLQLATGAGKSIIISMVMEYMRRIGLRVCLIVPNINLLEQFKTDIISYNLNELAKEIHLIGGDNIVKHLDSQMTITTRQSLTNLMHLWEDIDCIIADECHQAKANDLSKIITYAKDTPFKLGFTGTLPELYIDKITLIGCIGEHIEYIAAKELIERGLGTPITIYGMFLKYSHEEAKEVKKLKTYQKEVKYLEEHEKRNKFVTNLTRKIADKHGNTILIFQHTKHGEKLYNNLTGIKLTPKMKNNYEEQAKCGVFFINGEVKGENRERIRKILEVFNNAIIVANTAVLSTGVNIPKLHNMVFSASSKSEVRVRQSLGRGIRTHDTKALFRVYDIVDDLTYITRNGNAYNNYMLNHWETRNEIYQQQYFNIEEIEISFS